MIRQNKTRQLTGESNSKEFPGKKTFPGKKNVCLFLRNKYLAGCLVGVIVKLMEISSNLLFQVHDFNIFHPEFTAVCNDGCTKCDGEADGCQKVVMSMLCFFVVDLFFYSHDLVVAGVCHVLSIESSKGYIKQ